MRTESVLMLLAIGLVFGEQTARVLGNGAYWIKVPRKNKWLKGSSGSGAATGAGYDDNDNYLEKLVTEYEIIPLMSKLI